MEDRTVIDCTSKWILGSNGAIEGHVLCCYCTHVGLATPNSACVSVHTYDDVCTDIPSSGSSVPPDKSATSFPYWLTISWVFVGYFSFTVCTHTGISLREHSSRFRFWPIFYILLRNA
ncbi:hypothetical protein EDB87DRAFT_785910 [Lactarius vividus]|nr:hypothetical protein EDB87DRAFT_785910 [Lactarius vividus]